MWRNVRSVFLLKHPLVLLLLAAMVSFPSQPAASTKVALIIGNSAYQHVPSLANPSNDADDIQQILTGIGFEVTRLRDADYETTRRTLAKFGDQAARAEVALIYFAGHGIEFERENYLIPIDAELKDARDLTFYGTPLEVVRRAVRPARDLSLVIIDACRDNPFLAQMSSSNRSLTRGLAQIEAQTQNELVAFSAKAGTVAQDGMGRNSPYAEALGQAFQTPGLEIGKLFRRVRDRVMAATNGQQEPALYGSLSEADFFFLPPDASGDASNPSSTAPPGSAATFEMAFWNSISNSRDPRDFKDYLARFPDGMFAGIAQRRLEEMQETERLAATSPDSELRPAAPREPEDASVIDPAEKALFTPSRAEVRDTQARLNILGHDAGVVDGLLGKRTGQAISAYQQAKGFAADGQISKQLMSALAADVPQSRLAAYYAEQEARREQARRMRQTNTRPVVQSESAAVPPEPAATQSTQAAKPDDSTDRPNGAVSDCSSISAIKELVRAGGHIGDCE